MKKYRYWFHFNKPLSKQKGYVIWTIHFRNKCYFVKNISCLVPSYSKTNKRQPYAVMQGYTEEVIIDKEFAIIKNNLEL